MAVLWLDDVDADDVGTVGGKAASLGELIGAGLPVPPGFAVTAGTYRTFIEEAGIDEELFSAVDVDPEDSAALRAAEERAEELILETPLPEPVREEILERYRSMGNEDDEAFVAVRSSATAEDLPDSSFAGQQETFLNVREEALLRRVKECWASLFTQRAIYYRQQRGFPHADVDIAVVVQRMVDAEKSGVMFTSHPSTGDPQITIEAAWGLGEAVVSGTVSPDNYVYDRERGAVDDVTVADKKVEMVKDPETGETVQLDVEAERRSERVLADGEIEELVTLGERVEDHYGAPQDVEWAVHDGDVYMLQSRPITTIRENDGVESGAGAGGETVEAATDGSNGTTVSEGNGEDDRKADVLVSGLGASPGAVTGTVQSGGGCSVTGTGSSCGSGCCAGSG
jgi:pyruvate,water dikinase